MHAVYHWWSSGASAAYQDMSAPIVLSIASLRAVSDIKITVIDSTDTPVDWGHFPQKLKFNVLHESCHLNDYSHLVDGWRHLSRIFNLYESSDLQNEKVYVDSDIFFFRDPFPLSCDSQKFCWNGWNTGFFYFDSSSSNNKTFYDIFKSYCISGIYSEEFRSIMKKCVNYDAWYGVWDEMVLGYMKRTHPHLFNIIPITEHVTSEMMCTHEYNKDELKVFHCNGSMIEHPSKANKHCRGLLPLMCEEFYQNIIKVLDENDLRMIFEAEMLRYYSKNKFSLLNSIPKMRCVKQHDGHYLLGMLAQYVRFI